MFDASCKTSTGESMTSNLVLGLKLQKDNFEIFTQFSILRNIFFLGHGKNLPGLQIRMGVTKKIL